MSEYKFPDEMDDNTPPEVEIVEEGSSNEPEIEIVDSTPEKDRGRKPLDRVVEDPTEDEMKQYSEGVKKRISELTHARHDERRKAEALAREREEFERAARALMDENQRLKQYVQTGEQEYSKVATTAAEAELTEARRKLKEAHESFDTDAIIAAQEALSDAKVKLDRAKNFRPAPLQKEQEAVQMQPSIPAQPKVDEATLRWQARNQWFGSPDHEDMSLFAIGVHKKLVANAVDPRSKEYYEQIDARMKSTFPEFFGVEDRPRSGDGSRKPSTVVAPATRSTSARKIQLTPEQVAVARRLGITPQQYAVELVKMERSNG
jgi:DNA repair exonuclease SbcCD ATPase subunit